MGVLGEEMLNRVATKSAPRTLGRVDCRLNLLVRVAKCPPSLPFPDGAACNVVLLLSKAMYVSTGPQRDILAIQPNQLGNLGSRLHRGREECFIGGGPARWKDLESQAVRRSPPG